MKPQNILIDTDLGDDVDDVLALAFALLRPELSVKAITTTTFDSYKRAQIVGKLLKIMGRTDVPFAPGMNFPLRSITPAEEKILTEVGGYKLNHASFVKPDDALPAPGADAVALMAQTIEAHAGDIALVTLGPLTNVAVLLRRHPHLAPKIQWIAMMGGELELNRSEHNVSWDVTATDIVFTSGVPLFLGTWSVTRQFVLTPADCARIKNLGTPLGAALSECIELWWPHKGGKPGPVMYDVAPVLWSFDRSFFSTESLPVRIETHGQTTTGWTTRSGSSAPTEVTVAMRAQAVRELYLNTICGIA